MSQTLGVPVFYHANVLLLASVSARILKKSVGLFLLAVLCTLNLPAQGTFVYTNNDRIPNTISAFSAAANGALNPIPGSPFASGGTGAGGGFFASPRITTAVVKDFLFAANSGSNNVSVFSINPTTGVLTAVAGSPFATGGVAGGVGMSLTATPDDQFLIAANGSSRTVTVFSIAANGSLSQVAGSPFPSGAGGALASAKVTSDGKFLAISWAPGNISVFSISATGGLTLVPGSPCRLPVRPVLTVIARARSFMSLLMALLSPRSMFSTSVSLVCCRGYQVRRSPVRELTPTWRY